METNTGFHVESHLAVLMPSVLRLCIAHAGSTELNRVGAFPGDELAGAVLSFCWALGLGTDPCQENTPALPALCAQGIAYKLTTSGSAPCV